MAFELLREIESVTRAVNLCCLHFLTLVHFTSRLKQSISAKACWNIPNRKYSTQTTAVFTWSRREMALRHVSKHRFHFYLNLHDSQRGSLSFITHMHTNIITPLFFFVFTFRARHTLVKAKPKITWNIPFTILTINILIRSLCGRFI